MTDVPVSGPEPLLDAVVRRAAQLEAATAAPVRRMKIQSDGMTVEIEWSVEGGAPRPPAPPPAEKEPTAEEGTVTVTAPAVGVFYRAPEPGAEPFVKVGDRVAPGQQVGILEAMKLMNPIEADQAGVITEILVDNETPVEYGQPLMLLKTDPQTTGGA